MDIRIFKSGKIGSLIDEGVQIFYKYNIKLINKNEIF